MNETSVSLLNRARGDSGSGSWQRIVSIYTPLLQAWMRKYDLQPADVDDLVQDVLLTVARELPRFEHSGRTGAFRNWLRTTLVNRLRASWKSSSRRPLVSGSTSLLEQLNQLEDEASSASRIWAAEHDRHVMTQLLHQIRPRFQETTWEAFRRQMFRGERGRAVAEDLGISLKAVQLAKSRVLNALRAETAGLIDC